MVGVFLAVFAVGVVLHPASARVFKVSEFCPEGNCSGCSGGGGGGGGIGNPCDPNAPTAQCADFFWTRERWLLGASSTERVVNYSIKCNSIPNYLSSSTVIAAINRTFGTWNLQTAGKLRYHYLGCNNTAPAGWREDGLNIVSFFDQTSIGLTHTVHSTTAVNDEFGKSVLPMLEFDIILDSATPNNAPWTVAPEGTALTGEYEVENIMAHEVGHSLGLDHLTNNPGANELTMRYSTAELNVTKRQSLGVGDIDGAKCIYTKALGDHCQVGLNQ